MASDPCPVDDLQCRAAFRNASLNIGETDSFGIQDVIAQATAPLPSGAAALATIASQNPIVVDLTNLRRAVRTLTVANKVIVAVGSLVAVAAIVAVIVLAVFASRRRC